MLPPPYCVDAATPGNSSCGIWSIYQTLLPTHRSTLQYKTHSNTFTKSKKKIELTLFVYWEEKCVSANRKPGKPRKVRNVQFCKFNLQRPVCTLNCQYFMLNRLLYFIENWWKRAEVNINRFESIFPYSLNILKRRTIDI